MKKIYISSLFILLGVLCLLNFSACGKEERYDNDNEENNIIEEFTGEVTYYDKVVIDEKNHLLIIRTGDTEIPFNVLPATEIIGKETISVGDIIKITNKREDYNSTYREAIKIEVLSNKKQ